eukprot:316051-Chlamydomonas_euryale.AAC.2
MHRPAGASCLQTTRRRRGAASPCRPRTPRAAPPTPQTPQGRAAHKWRPSPARSTAARCPLRAGSRLHPPPPSRRSRPTLWAHSAAQPPARAVHRSHKWGRARTHERTHA